MELNKVLAQHKVPLVVSTKQPLTCNKMVVVPTDAKLLVYDTVTEKRLKIIDNRSSRVYYLPLTSQQKFERLPLDPMFDDMAFDTVAAVVERCPTKLPNVLRCVQEFYTDVLEYSVPLDECFDVHGVEEDKDGYKYLCGELQSNKQKIRMPAHQITASFSAMPSEELEHASDLAKLKMPQRVRIIPELPDGVLVKRENLQVLTIQSVEEVCFAIATSPDTTLPISIPTNIDFVNHRYKYSVVHTDALSSKLFLSLLQLRNFLNLTLEITEVGISKLPAEWERIPQPLPHVLEKWMDCHEGRKYAESINEHHIEDLNVQIMESKCAYSALLSEIREKNTRPLGTRPPALLPRGSKTKPEIKPKPPPRPPRRSSSNDQPITSPVILDARDDTESYEYLDIGDLRNQQSGQLDHRAVADELKAALTKKEMKIEALKKDVESLAEYKKKCKDLEKTNSELMKTITKLENSLEECANPEGHYSQLPCDLEMSPPSYEDLEGCDPKSGTSTMKIRSMSVGQVCLFLNTLGLQEYTEKFRSELIDGSMLLHLDKEVMVEDLGMRPLHAIRLLSWKDR